MIASGVAVGEDSPKFPLLKKKKKKLSKNHA